MELEMKKIIVSLGLLLIASTSFAETPRERLMSNFFLTVPKIRVIQAATGVSDQDWADAFGYFSKDDIAAIRNFTPEDLVAMQKKQEEQEKSHAKISGNMEQKFAAAQKRNEEIKRSPKVYVREILKYPAIMIIRNVQNVPDNVVAEVALRGPFPSYSEEEIKARLQAVRDLTPEEVEKKRKEYEQQKAEWQQAMREFENDKK
jgi:hypothetical protein